MQDGSSNRHWITRLAILAPYAWLVAFFLLPFLIVLKISLSQTAIAQPPYAPVFDLAAGWEGLKAILRRRCRSTVTPRMFADSLYVWSYWKSLQVAAISTADPAADRLSGRLCARARAAPLAGRAGAAGGAAVLDLVPDPRLCVDEHPAARRAAQSGAARAAHHRRAGLVACDRPRGLYRHRLFVFPVHGAAALRGAREDGRDAARSRRRSRRPPWRAFLQRDGAAVAARHRRRVRCSASSRSSASSSFPTCSARPRPR